MKQKISWAHWLSEMIRDFITENSDKSPYEIAHIYECRKTGCTKAVVKLSERHFIEKNIRDIVVDNEFLDGFDKKTIRTLTYMATVERLKPDYSIVVHEMTDKIDDYLLEIKSKQSGATFKKSPSEISKNKQLIDQFNPIEASRIGYMAGVHETVKEYLLMQNKR
jgi:hypothetical protein